MRERSKTGLKGGDFMRQAKRYLISIVAYLMLDSMAPGTALAACTREAIMRPDGTVIVCLRCCGPIGCNTFCD